MPEDLITEESDPELWAELEVLYLSAPLIETEPGWVIRVGKHYQVIVGIDTKRRYLPYNTQELIESTS